MQALEAFADLGVELPDAEEVKVVLVGVHPGQQGTSRAVPGHEALVDGLGGPLDLEEALDRIPGEGAGADLEVVLAVGQVAGVDRHEPVDVQVRVPPTALSRLAARVRWSISSTATTRITR